MTLDATLPRRSGRPGSETRPGTTLLLFILFSILSILACSSSSTSIGNPLSIELSVNPPSGLADVDTFTFQYDAEGRNLLGVVLEFGDGQADSLAAQGSTRAAATRPHVYEQPGTYEAVARVLESFGPTLADTVEVEVQIP